MRAIDAEPLFGGEYDDLWAWRFELVEQSKLMAVNHRLREWFKERDAECMALVGQLQRSQKRLQQAQARARRAEERVGGQCAAKWKESRGQEG